MVRCFSLVAEIGWLASLKSYRETDKTLVFQSRCRDWVVGENLHSCRYEGFAQFQSRCRDWVVGELNFHRLIFSATPRFSLVAEIGWLASFCCCRWNYSFTPVSVSLPRLGGWRGNKPCGTGKPTTSFSLVAEIGWLARLFSRLKSRPHLMFQSRCRDWVVGEHAIEVCPRRCDAFQSRCRDWVVGEL